MQDGSFAYDMWNGTKFERHTVQMDFKQAEAIFETVKEPFVPPYVEELNLGGERKRGWKRIIVSGSGGFIENHIVGYGQKFKCQKELDAAFAKQAELNAAPNMDNSDAQDMNSVIEDVKIEPLAWKSDKKNRYIP